MDDFSGSQFVYDSIDSATDDLSRKLSDVAHRWIQTGVLLGVEWAWLVSLRERRVTAQQSLRETLRHWLDSLGEVTLPRLVEAIEHSAGANDSRLAEAMKSPMLADECSPSSQVDQEQVNGAAQGGKEPVTKLHCLLMLTNPNMFCVYLYIGMCIFSQYGSVLVYKCTTSYFTTTF